MTPPDAKPATSRRSRATIEQLYAATVELIAELGWDNTSSRRVADRAGVSLGVVHYHFESIDQLRRQAAIEQIERFFGDATAFAGAGADPHPPSAATAIRRLFSALSDGDPRRLELNVLYQSLVAAMRDDQLRAELAAQIAQYRTFAADWLDSLGVHEPERAAATIVAAVDGFLLQRSLDPSLDPELIADGLVRLAAPTHTPAPPTR